MIKKSFIGLGVIGLLVLFSSFVQIPSTDSNTLPEIKTLPVSLKTNHPHATTPQKPSSIYDVKVKDIIGNKVSMSRYKGKVLLIVNVASKCRFTNQYQDLQALYEEYQDDDFVVLAFPANNFDNQEPGSNQEIKHFCTSKYGITFPMFSKISVKGDDIHPLYEYLTSKKENKRLDAPIRWNFQKFLVGKDGKVIRSFRPAERVKDATIKQAIRKHVKGF